MISIKTQGEVEILREGGKILAQILDEIVRVARAGISTLELDRLAEGLIFKCGGRPAFKGYKIKETRRPYPASLCVSVNDEIVHAIPRKEKILQEGDVVGLDIGMAWPANATTNYPAPMWRGSSNEIGRQLPTTNSLYTDTAITIGVGKISPEAERLIRETKEALDTGIRAVRPRARIGDISHAIQKHLEKNKLGIIRDLGGHGVGYKLHEEPLIPNYGKPGIGPELCEGMVLAIEPMATLGGWLIVLDDDEWTFKTADGSLAAHFEHTVVVTKDGVEVLTS